MYSRRGFHAVLVLAILLSPHQYSARAQPPQGQQNSDDVLRQNVLRAIDAGQKALIRMQKADGSWPNSRYAQNTIGLGALATLALLTSGVPADSEPIQKAIRWLKRPGTDPTRTYDIALVIMALRASGDPAVRGKVAKLAQRLEDFQLRGANSGSWGYYGEQGWHDNSNTQFAILGLREAVYLGIPVDPSVWRRTQDHFLTTQIGSVDNRNGAGWDYRGVGEPTGSMTVAGIASLSITDAMLPDEDAINPDGTINCCGAEVRPVEKAIDAGTLWLSTHFRVRANPGSNQWPLYYMYGLERAGRFTGHRFFGDHDWYREGAEFLVKGQSIRDGVWRSVVEDEVAGTSLALLFLSKGLSPVLLNKLKFGPRDPQTGEVIGRGWNRHNRDVANLVEYTSGLPKWPKLMSWQVVDLRTASAGEGVSALLQSPVQYLSSDQSPALIQGAELTLLRDYLAQGGFLFAVQNCQSAEFDTGFRDLVQRLFDGQYELRKLPSTHDVYRSEFVFPPGVEPPELWGVDFGCRTAIIYAPYDHACRWHHWLRFDDPDRPIAARTQIDKSMKIGVNVIAYATGREVQDKLNRPEPLAAADLRQMNRGALTIARLRHTGGWDTAPHALRRLQMALEAVNIDAAANTPNLAPNDPEIFNYPLLYMHGRKNFQFTEAEMAGLKQYLEQGGFLFADACCGANQFDESFRRMIEQTFGKPLERIPPEHELFHPELGYDIRQVERRIPSSDPQASALAVEATLGEPILEGLEINGRYAVIYSKYDLSCALEGQSTAACAGYSKEDAVRIGVNLVLYGLLQ